MKFLFDKRVMFSALVVSSVFLIISFMKFQKNDYSQNQEPSSKISQVKSKIELEQFKIEKNVLDKELIAFGVIDSKTCPTCINEMLEYLIELKNIDKRFFNENGIEKKFIITADDLKDAERFIKAIDIEHNWFFVSHEDSFSKLITKWPEANSYSNQWLFINPQDSLIVSRIIVGNASTSIVNKRSLLNEAIFAY